MTDHQTIPMEIDRIAEHLQEKMSVRGRDLGTTLARTRHRLPRRVRRQADTLAKAEPMARHPKLRRILDADALHSAAREVGAHLESIDTADRRKGWLLGILGGLSFNLLVLFALVIVVLVWRGFL